MMTAGDPNTLFTEEAQAIMKDLAQVRREAYQMDFTLYFETEWPLQIPLFFGEVSDCLSNSCGCLMHTLGAGDFLLKVVGPELWYINPFRACTKEARQNCDKLAS